MVVFAKASLDGTDFSSGPESGTTTTDEPDLMSDADVAALFAPAPQPHAATAFERSVEATPLPPECDGPLMGEALFPPPLTPNPITLK